jgi:hypothetical protein
MSDPESPSPQTTQEQTQEQDKTYTQLTTLLENIGNILGLTEDLDTKHNSPEQQASEISE